jgi:hypothetical protein
LSPTDFEQMQNTQGGLMSFNNFLSTSLDRAVSHAFAESNQHNPNLIGVLFEINIDLKRLDQLSQSYSSIYCFESIVFQFSFTTNMISQGKNRLCRESPGIFHSFLFIKR